jgi:DNA polymerase alpha-associated DNA helicase A
MYLFLLKNKTQPHPTTLPQVTFKRYREALEKLGKGDDSCKLRNILFGATEPTFNDRPPPIEILDASLNGPQIEAIKFAMAANDVALIHGPPGTGKVHCECQCVDVTQTWT